MVLNATFNNVSAISWQLVFLVQKTRVPGENHKPATGGDKSNYHMITTTMFKIQKALSTTT